MTPWSLSSRDVNSLSCPISLPTRRVARGQWTPSLSPAPPHSPLCRWIGSGGSVWVARDSRKDAWPRDLAGGRCPLLAPVPAVQPSGHALGAEAQVSSASHLLFCAGFEGRWVFRDCPRSRQDRSPRGWGRHVTRPAGTWRGTARRRVLGSPETSLAAS